MNSESNKTYLVTGVSGFIASQTARTLLAQGHTVVGIDNLNNYYDIRLKLYRLCDLLGTSFDYQAINAKDNVTNEFPPATQSDLAVDSKFVGHQGKFIYYRIDIENLELLLTLFEKWNFDAVLNLAARAGVRYSMENPFVYMTTNANATLNLLECMRRNGVLKLVQASTSSLYAGQKMPFTEDLSVNTPISPYAASKKAAEAIAYSYYKLYDIDVSIVRYFTVFGPAGRPDMCLFRFIKWISSGDTIELFGDGEQSRDFTYVEDIASGTIAALKTVGFEIFNLGGGNNPISLNTLIGWLEKMLDKKALIENKPFHKADIVSTWADIGKANEQLGWHPQTSVKDGVQATVDWHKDNSDWLKDIRL